MSEEIEIELGDSNSGNWSIDQIMMSGIIYDGLIESYGKQVVDAVIEKLEIHKNDLGLENNTKIILRVLNGDI